MGVGFSLKPSGDKVPSDIFSYGTSPATRKIANAFVDSARTVIRALANNHAQMSLRLILGSGVVICRGQRNETMSRAMTMTKKTLAPVLKEGAKSDLQTEQIESDAIPLEPNAIDVIRPEQCASGEILRVQHATDRMELEPGVCIPESELAWNCDEAIRSLRSNCHLAAQTCRDCAGTVAGPTIAVVAVGPTSLVEVYVAGQNRIGFDRRGPPAVRSSLGNPDNEKAWFDCENSTRANFRPELSQLVNRDFDR